MQKVFTDGNMALAYSPVYAVVVAVVVCVCVCVYVYICFLHKTARV